jgi:electron transfer flavoprotein beta subunit
MKIMVSVKQVPARDSSPSDPSFAMNEPDAYALEEALQLREKLGGEVVVVCAGPASAGQTIREALAKGADRAIHIETDGERMPDALATGTLLAQAIKPEAPDFVLTGLQSDDLGYGQTGVVLAELLGFAHATIVMEVEPLEGQVRVKRELEDGWFQHVTLPLPAVLTIQSGIKKLRYATLMGIKKAKTKEVRVISSEAFAAVKVERVYAPQRSKKSQIFTGDARTAAKELAEKLKFEARVL